MQIDGAPVAVRIPALQHSKIFSLDIRFVHPAVSLFVRYDGGLAMASVFASFAFGPTYYSFLSGVNRPRILYGVTLAGAVNLD